tara:strand:+ start:535 stop:819 length:285 start_codon:yes stop_codon:yes gene_type:complete
MKKFLDAQESIFETALTELKSGQKQSHWMWFIFPQIAGLGESETAQHYAIADAVEARTYLTITKSLAHACLSAPRRCLQSRAVRLTRSLAFPMI